MDAATNLSTTQTTVQRAEQRLSALQLRYVRLLEMPAAQAEEEVRRAIEDMPALEKAELSDTEKQGEEAEFSETADQLQRADYANDEEIPVWATRSEGGATSQKEDIGQGEKTLLEALMEQYGEIGASADERLAARYIAGNFDSNGYMTRRLEAVADDMAIAQGRQMPTEVIKRAFERLRSFEPAGVGAWDLRDCLLLQLKRLPQSNPDHKRALEIVAHYFDLFSLRHFDKIASAMEITVEEVSRANDVIRHLQPKPGAAFPASNFEDASARITPDFLVEVESSGLLTVTLLHNIPELRLSQSFAEDVPLPVAATARGREAARQFLRGRRTEALEFIRAVKMRQSTLMSVAGAIVRLQRDFFLTDDISKVRPMILKDIAAITGYDVSTISRATQGKYVATSGGVYPLKMLFGERSTLTAPQEEATSLRVAQRVRELVEKEDAAKPLTDEALTAKLSEEGFNIARRTVAKYRERAGFPVARLRKK